jgi:hypothetical protein
LPDDLLMAEMNPVENADGQANPVAALTQLIGNLNYLHARLISQFNLVTGQLNTISRWHPPQITDGLCKSGSAALPLPSRFHLSS